MFNLHMKSKNKFWVIQDLDYSQSLSYSQEVNVQDPGLNKFTLDLYLPKTNQNIPLKSSCDKTFKHEPIQYMDQSRDVLYKEMNQNATPIVVFVHGGGWRRGHKEGWRHYISVYDTNLLVAAFLRFFGIFGNIGESFAKCGVACAVVSYPLVRLSMPGLLLEGVASMFMSCLLCLPAVTGVVLVMYIASICLNIDSVSWIMQYLHHPYCSFVLVLLTFTQLITWVVLITTRHAKHCPCHARCCGSILLIMDCMLFVHLLINHVVTPDFFLILLACSVTCLVQGTLMYSLLFTVKTASSYKEQAVATAKSIQWVYQFGCSTRLFQSDYLFLMGHSAGAHLVSLLTLDSTYLADIGCDVDTIKGVIGVSGVYDIDWLKGHFLQKLYLEPVFGSDPNKWKHASPQHILVQKRHRSMKENMYIPPFLIFSAEWDLSLHGQTLTFVSKLREHTDVKYFTVPRTDHLSIMGYFGHSLNMKNSCQSMEELCLAFIHDSVKGYTI